jgi:hypothetical protein
MDVRRWAREGMLTGGFFRLGWERFGQAAASAMVRREADSLHLTFRYRVDGVKWKETRCTARLAWTPCNYGGQRTWILCPLCGRRVAILYGGANIACRHCFNLAYPCTREGKAERAMRRSNRIRARLGWKPGFWSECGSRPKYMHEHTYNLLALRYYALAEIALKGIAGRY